MRLAVLAMAAAVALVCALPIAGAQQGVDADAVRLREEAQRIGTLADEAQEQDAVLRNMLAGASPPTAGMAQTPTAARREQLTREIEARLRGVSPQAQPTLWGSLQVSLAIAQNSGMQAMGFDAEENNRGLAAVNAALGVLTRENAPYDWALAQQTRAEIAAASIYEGSDDAQVEAISARSRPIAEQGFAAALTVFTRERYPREYLQLKCRRNWYGLMAGEEGINADNSRATVQNRACRSLTAGDLLNERERAQNAASRESLIESAVAVMEHQANGGRVGPDAETLRRMPRQQRQQVEEMMKQSREAMQANTGDGEVVLLIEKQRGSFLNAALAMDESGLPPEDIAQARRLRARAEALEAQTPSGRAYRDNVEMWRAYAELYDIFERVERRPQAVIPGLDAPVLAPVILDEDRGFVAVYPLRGQGALVPTSMEWVRSASLMAGREALTQQDYRDMARQNAREFRQRAGASMYLQNLPLLGLAFRGDVQRAQKDVVASQERRQREAARARVQQQRDARTDRATESYSRRYRSGEQVRAIEDFRQRFETSWSGTLRTGAQRAGAAPGGRIILLPDGLASALPLGILRDARGRTLIDDYEIVYAPNLASYAAATRRARAPRAPALMSFAMSQAESGLPFAQSELGIVRGMFGAAPVDMLANGARKNDLVARMAGASYWHFATHGTFEFDNPRSSGLELGGGERLTLGDLFDSEAPLGAPRLVVLSACETGLFDAEHNPDEFIGLPTGFLQAGAAGVIASLWQVPDLATTLMMGKLYRLHLVEGQRPSQALRNAQLWLKSARKGELAAMVNELARAGAIGPGEAGQMLGEIGAEGEDPPYAHPLYWGAWVYYGA